MTELPAVTPAACCPVGFVEALALGRLLGIGTQPPLMYAMATAKFLQLEGTAAVQNASKQVAKKRPFSELLRRSFKAYGYAGRPNIAGFPVPEAAAYWEARNMQMPQRRDGWAGGGRCRGCTTPGAGIPGLVRQELMI